MPELFNHDKLLVGRDGDDIHPVYAIEDEKLVRLVRAGRNLLVGTKAKNPKKPAKPAET